MYKLPILNAVHTAIIEGSEGTYTADQSGAFHKLVSFDCRGLEPFDFDPRVCTFHMSDNKTQGVLFVMASYNVTVISGNIHLFSSSSSAEC